MTQSNKEVLARKREKVKEWKLNNREKVLAQKKRHYDKYKHREKNREAMLAREKEYREKNKEKIAKRAREYYQKNQDK